VWAVGRMVELKFLSTAPGKQASLESKDVTVLKPRPVFFCFLFFFFLVSEVLFPNQTFLVSAAYLISFFC
jgi:hypothetical protein